MVPQQNDVQGAYSPQPQDPNTLGACYYRQPFGRLDCIVTTWENCYATYNPKSGYIVVTWVEGADCSGSAIGDR